MALNKKQKRQQDKRKQERNRRGCRQRMFALQNNISDEAYI